MKGKTSLCLALAVSMLLGVFMIGPVSASSTTVGVEPDSIVDLGLGPGSTFTVEIWIRDVQDLAGLEFYLGYDTTVLTATLIEYGDIFGPTYFPIWSEINDAEGYLRYAVRGELGQPGIYGDGRAAIITFGVDSVGESNLDLYDTLLSDSLVPPGLILHDALDGYFNNLGAVFGWIEGTVTDADTLLPIEGATVSADGISDVTDPSGFYSLAASPGTYDVTAEMTGYEPQTVMDVSVAADATVVQDFALTPFTPVFGWIEGTVTDADTLLPIEGATVSADGYSDTTDASGFYSLTVTPGTYDVTAKRAGYLIQTATVVVVADTTTIQDFSLSPAPPTTIGVEPPSMVDPGLGPGSTFTVEIWVRNHVDIRGVEFKLGYDTTVLTATLIEYGDIFGPTYLPLVSQINDAEGYLQYVVIQALGEPGVGDGRAAIITFDVDSVGESNLDLYDTGLADSSVPPIQIVHDALDGYFSNTPPPPFTTIGVEPDSIVDLGLGPGSTFTVEIWVRNHDDLLGVEFKLGYDTTVLTATLIEYGDIFGPTYFPLTSEINDAEGWLHYGIMQALGEPGVGDGRVAIITFDVDSVGESDLDLYETKIGDSSVPPVPVVHDTLDGYFRNAEVSASLIRRRAWPEHHHYSLGKDEDFSNDLFAIVSNNGDVDTWVKVVFTVTNHAGDPIDGGTFNTTAMQLLAGEKYGHKAGARYKTSFVPPAVGRYYVSAVCWADTDGDTAPDTPMGKIKTFAFNVVA